VKRLFLDLGEYGHLTGAGVPIQQWQDHGLGLVRTILHAAGLETDLASRRLCANLQELAPKLRGYDMLLMNVRSYTFVGAREAARVFKRFNPSGIVIVGGMHATVDIDGMTAVDEFDHIVQGGGENVIVDLVRDHEQFDRVIKGQQSRSMADWPMIDRTLWPKEAKTAHCAGSWPLEAACGWGPPPVATMMTSRVCPWKCAFCNEASFIPNMDRRPVEAVIDELNWLDKTYGPLGSVVIHDSMFFQNPPYLKEWIEKYPKLARKPWPYWAAARADTVRKWPDLFEALVRETNWTSVSIGFESGSDRVLKMLNKECTAEDNLFTIDLLNRIGDDLEAQGRERPRFWANVMFGIPGETKEDVLATKRMIRRMVNPMLTPATYAPFPGSMLGYQITAEGKSHLGDSHFRFLGGKYMEGIDYGLLADIEAGAYQFEIESEEWLADAQPGPLGDEKRKPSRFYLFPLKNGKKRLAYGTTPDEAREILSWRMNAYEMSEIADGPPLEIRQQDVHPYLKELA
jgi:hypothetical protein